MLRTLSLAALALVASAACARAEVQTKPVTYEYAGTTFKGYVAWDDSVQGKRPGVLVLHEWWGLNDYARKRAEQLAKLGYVAFAGDMYGEGKVTQHPKEAAAMAGAVRKNVKEWVGRARAALEVLKKFDKTDPDRLAAIGYCFGGSTALVLAYSGADLDAVSTFHAALPTPEPEQAKAIKARLLIHHGAADPFVPDKAVQAARDAFEKADVDYVLAYYGNAKHSFTVPDIAKANVEGLAYNAEADRRSWQATQYFFREIFGKKK